MKKYLIGLLVFWVVVGYGQDIHYSQFYNAPLIVNPAKTGIFNGDMRFNFSYKNQWSSVPVPWRTFSVAIDKKFYPKKSDQYFFSGGLMINYDKQASGISNLTFTNIGLTGSYTRILNSSNLLTFGLQLGYAGRGLDQESLTWDRQWDGETFDPSLPSGESFNPQTVTFLENAIGVNYRWQKSNRTHLDLGVGVYHLIEPNVSFFGTSDDIKLPRRVSLTGIGTFQMSESMDFQLHGLAQFQGDFSEYVFGGLVKLYVNNTPGSEFQIHLGANYRTRQSLIPIVAVQYKNFYLSASYDIDLSEIGREHTSNRGGFEIHGRYIIANLPAPRKIKVCPIY